MRKKICLAMFSLFVLTACTKETEIISYEQISMEEMPQMMEEESDYIILDVRTVDEFKQGHLPRAVCIPNESIGEKEIPELSDKEQLIFAYCRSGNRSKQAAKKLVAQGYKNIIEIGGILDWEGETVVEK